MKTKKKIVVGQKVEESKTESTFKSGSENNSSTHAKKDTAETFVGDISICDAVFNLEIMESGSNVPHDILNWVFSKMVWVKLL